MKQLLIVFSFALLTGCGFQPVYGSSGSSLASAGNITVEPIPGRAGYILRRELQRELAIGLPGVPASSSLNVILDVNLTRLAFKADGAAARSSLGAKGRYVLASSDGAVNGRVDTAIDFAVPDAPYGDISAQSGATDRAARQLAKRIVEDLRLKLADK